MAAERGGASHRSGLTWPAGDLSETHLAGLGLLTGVELLARLGRTMPVLLTVAPHASYRLLDGDPRLRRLPAAVAAAAAVAASRTGVDADVPRDAGPVAVPRDIAGAQPAMVVRLELEALEVAPPAAEPSAALTAPAGAVQLLLTVAPDAVTARAWCACGSGWEYAAAAVAEMAGEIFSQLVARPDIASGQVDAIGAASRVAVLGSIAGSAYPPPGAPAPLDAVPRQIERVAAASPDRVAMIHAGRRLTYRQVDHLANAVAAQLSRQGARRGVPVPVVGGGGMPFAITALALMKLGAPYVPLDEAWPDERVRLALDLLAADLVVALEPQAALPPVTAAVYRLELDRVQPLPTALEPVELVAEDPVYAMFTSGSTGTPKCAVNLHGGLANRLSFMSRYFAATGTEVVLQTTRHTADSSFWQMFWPLTTGGCAVLPEPGDVLDLEQVVAAIATHRVTMTDLVPRALRALVGLAERDTAARAALSSLRHLVVGGEAIDPRAAHRLRELLPSVRLTNGYGPTEASIGMIFHPVSPDDGPHIPLGRPIDNCYALIVDADLRLLPPGAPGEIVIGGACLGAGYHRDPGRTAVAFVTNPYPQLPARRLYRTGDLGYLDPQANLRFLGRRDDQVNIGGVRVEPAEVEAAALDCPGITAAKLITGDLAGRPVLALFAAAAIGSGPAGHRMVPGAGSRPTAAELRAHLLAVLPRTQVPAYCVVLPALPVTDSGKVDVAALRRRLDGLDVEHLNPDGPATDQPVSPALSVLRGLPGLAGLAAQDDVMAAGVDSLQALDAVWRLREAYRVEVGVQDLFDHPHPAALDRVLRGRVGSGTHPDEYAQMDQDAQLLAEIEIQPGSPAGPVRTVLVTGATGFVGGRSVAELLDDGVTTVICLCRAADDHAARERVVAWLRRQHLWREEYTSRLVAYAGDLSRTRLGLGESTWTRLSIHTDLIMHVGALVNFVYDYADHRRANVLGTHEVLRLAMQGRPKPVHHVSTLGVLAHAAARGGIRLDEQVDPVAVPPPPGGYSRSKWVAERLLLQARDKGATVTLFRLGEVMPAADNGFANPRALTHLLCRAFHRLGRVPDVAMRTDYTPVDQVARALAAAVHDRSAWNATYHVFDPAVVCLGDLVDQARVPADEFLAALRAAAVHDAQLTVLDALLRQRSGRQAGVFDGLLDENPALFAQDGYRRMARRWRLAAAPLPAAVMAYRRFLAAESGPPRD